MAVEAAATRSLSKNIGKAVVAVGSVTCLLSTFSKISRSQFGWPRSATAKVEDVIIYDFAILLLNLRRFFVLIPFRLVLVALVSCRSALRSSANGFHVT